MPMMAGQCSVRLPVKSLMKKNTTAPRAGPHRYFGPPMMAMMSTDPDRLQCSMSGETKPL